MKKKMLGLILGAAVFALAGCGGQAGTEAAATDAQAASEETASAETGPASEEAATEEAATEEAPAGDELSAAEEDYSDYPEDFVQNQSGVLQFKDYDEIISYLKPGQGYAYVKVDGAADDVLLITDMVFEADKTAGEVSVYGIKDGAPLFMGVIAGNGSAYPIRYADGKVYGGDNHRIDTYFIVPDTMSIIQKDYVDDGVNDGSNEFVGFLRKEPVFYKDEDFTGGQEAFDALAAEREAVPAVTFTMIEGDASESGNSTASAAEGKLPPYEYPGPELFYSVVYKYVTDEFGKGYDKSDVSIPCILVAYVDESNKDDILVYGDFWVMNYDLEGDTLMNKSGGSYPGVMHLKSTREGYDVTKMDIVEDGSNWDKSAREIFGERYDECMKLISDDKLREKTRAQIIANYVAANNLAVTQYQDYGWDPVKLPEENIDTFYSDLD
ncbi:MAG: hypothetical protein J5966_08700 [Lachnospiraceae bacterium]|nr:hypothetical protein [Lachnospiraceae bacterium]